jgi:hypothetical protein
MDLEGELIRVPGKTWGILGRHWRKQENLYGLPNELKGELIRVPGKTWGVSGEALAEARKPQRIISYKTTNWFLHFVQ